MATAHAFLSQISITAEEPTLLERVALLLKPTHALVGDINLTPLSFCPPVSVADAIAYTSQDVYTLCTWGIQIAVRLGYPNSGAPGVPK